jgi:hypothetical protein
MTIVQRNISGFAVVILALLYSTLIPAGAQTQRHVNRPSMQEFYQYPPGSKAIDASYWDYLHPWNVETQPRPMLSEEALGKIAALPLSGATTQSAASELKAQLQASPLRYQFEMNRTILAGTDDALQARLTVAPVGSSGANSAIQVRSAQMIGSREFGSPDLGDVPYTCDTTGVCTFRWQAPSTEKKYWGTLVLRVTLAVSGSKDSYIATQNFYSSPMVAGTFTGTFQEKLENGSLVVDAGVNVQQHMACFVRANLYSADGGTPLQHVERRMLVDPSMKTISLTFFGKIFRDYGDQGAFRVQDLQAACQNLPYPAEWYIDPAAHEAEWREFQKNPPATREPGRIYFSYNTYSYTTHTYALNEFSNAEWQSADKTAALSARSRAMAAGIAHTKAAETQTQP